MWTALCVCVCIYICMHIYIYIYNICACFCFKIGAQYITMAICKCVTVIMGLFMLNRYKVYSLCQSHTHSKPQLMILQKLNNDVLTHLNY